MPTISSIKDLNIHFLMNRFQNRATLKSFVLNGQKYDSVLIKTKNTQNPPDMYIFRDNKFVSRTVTRTANNKNYEVRTDATQDGYISYASETNKEGSILTRTIETRFLNLGKLREIGFLKRIREKLNGIHINNKLPVKIRKTEESIGMTKLTYHNILSNGEHSKLSLNSSDGHINTKASYINEYADKAEIELTNYPPELVTKNDIKNHIEIVLKALGTFK